MSSAHVPNLSPLLLLLLLFTPSLSCTVTGRISFIDDVPFSPSMLHPASVWLQAHAFDHVTGAAPSAQDIYSKRLLLGTASCSSDGTWALTVNCQAAASANCTFGVIAFQSFDGSGSLRLDLEGGSGGRTAAIGWYVSISLIDYKYVTL
jgi:hypothetical protein